jgi:hypothetical protein
LSGSSHRTEHDGGYGQFQVGEFIDDDGVVAAELQQTFAKPTRHPFGDIAADGGGSGERHERDAPVIDETRGELGAGIDEQLKNGRQFVIAHHAIADVLNGNRRERRLGRRLPHGSIAANGGEERVPGPHGHGEIERRNDSHHAERMPLFIHAVLGPFRMHGGAVKHARLADGKIRDIDHLLDFTQPFGLDLAVLECDQRAQVVLGGAQGIA